jgi:hypothetical protein
MLQGVEKYVARELFEKLGILFAAPSPELMSAATLGRAAIDHSPATPKGLWPISEAIRHPVLKN